MTDEIRDLLIIFDTVQRVMRVETAARKQELDVDAVPAPRAVSSQCGVVLEARAADAPLLSDILANLDIEPAAVYRRRHGEAWTPSALSAAAESESVSLTQNTPYGGCGAKLAKGLLEKILCGLPRLVSDDLLVGIEYADDAGVVRLTDDIAVIHTTDFFPPMVDDPFAFGRIAAANALSDVYAMGGVPIAGMNLVSFPLQDHDVVVLKEILRGGISALQEAGAVLAGGHTIEGQELLYGLAVTGKVHPKKIWRNGGARPGDALVLTKPLGTGLITTAAKADLIDASQMGTALRWMGTLNGAAAHAMLDLSPHAVTDVTGFGLAGHVAEMAEASNVGVEISLEDLPVLPGALEAAASGFVPAGAGKNRESLTAVLDVNPEADPLRVDLALDPQTSGGLLAALSPQAAQTLKQRFGPTVVIGHVCEGAAGTVRLS
ncbi:MAG: selenide, water dikinase SelD [Thermoanaerobaculales bacterium]|nr:selenide, water dikinase SelD [Thermoanaerobaculales bacterium]